MTSSGHLRALGCGGVDSLCRSDLTEVAGGGGTVHPSGPMAKVPRSLSAAALDALKKVRSTLAPLDGVEETATHGNPTFKVGGKAFAVLDLYEGRDCLWMLVDPVERQDRLCMPGWFPSPYDPRETALCCWLDAVDWRRAKAFLRGSYQVGRLPKTRRKPGK